MDRQNAEQLFNVGRFKEAFAAIPNHAASNDGATSVLRAEILEHFGHHTEAVSLLDRTVRSGALGDATLSRAHLVYSRIASEYGDFDQKLRHLRKAVALGEQSGDLRRLCWGQLWLFALHADRTGPEAAQTLLDSLRANVIRLGEPAISAALHLFIAELDGKRGFTANALRHTRLAHTLLIRSPHLWLESWVQNNFLALHLMRCDFEEASEHGELALQASIDCGSVPAIRRCFGNLGRLHLVLGNFDTSLDYVNKAANYSSHDNEHRNAVRETMARVLMARGEYVQALEVVEQIDASVRQDTGAGRYVHRHSLLTKAESLARLGRFPEAVLCIERLNELATRAGEGGLATRGALLRAEVESLTGLAPQLPAAVTDLDSGPDEAISVHAAYERTMACILATAGKRGASDMHFARACRIFTGLRNTPELIEAERAVAIARSTAIPVESCPTSQPALDTLNNATALLLHTGRPALIVMDLMTLLRESQAVDAAVAVAVCADEKEEPIASFGALTNGEHVTFQLGSANGKELRVRVAPKADLESCGFMNSVSLLLKVSRELTCARLEREQRMAVWPLDDKPAGTDSVALGQMQKLMTIARRVAQTTISVLLTGESGTGKEVLARAIHTASPRAKRPFIPFNCTAIPRELLESQLFGYRRGAFTGADRDNPGLIRAAKDGTLFLDEIGELSLELQPKLLRFLESGEIHPLGDVAPFNVDVRIVAATNADLAKLVQEGRFREDLYYRLDVVKLEIPPLRDRRDEIPALVHHFIAKAATEFRKGRVRIAEETMEQLLIYPWPGNVRQLQNEMRRMVAMADNDAILGPDALVRDIRDELSQAQRTPGRPPALAIPLDEKLGPAVARIEREMIKAALQANDGRLEATAKALGISRKGLYLKRQRLGV